MKKAIHHFSRGVIIGLEVTGLLAVLVFLAWGALLVRLSQGPMNVDFLTARIEKAMNEGQAGFNFDVGTTDLTWGGKFAPLELQTRNVVITRADNTPVLSVDRIGVVLSKRHLIFGQIVPKVVNIHAPALRVIRQEDGSFTLNLGTAVPGIEEVKTEEKSQTSQQDLIRGLLQHLEEKRLPLFSGLNEIGISDAALFYEDHILGASWKSHKSDVRFVRDAGGILSEASITLDLDSEHTAVLRTSAWYDWSTRETRFLAAFSDFNPMLAAQGSEKLKAVADVDLPLKGSVALALDPDFRPGMTRFQLTADAGKFNAAGLYETPIPVTSLALNGHIDLKTWEGEIEKVRADLGGPVAEGSAKITLKDGGVKNVTAQALLSEMPLDDLKTFWPHSLTPDPRAWVTGHLSKGVAHTATLDLDLDVGADNKVKLNKVGGKIDFTGIKVDYFPPLMPVTAVDGTANYDDKSFNLDLTSGKLGDMTVSSSAIRITGLDTQNETTHSKIDIAVALQGPLKTALHVLDSKPLEYPKDLGIKTAEVEGTADVNVRFKFPLYHDLQLHEVDVKTDAKLNDVLLKDMVAGYDLTGGPMDLSVTNGTLKVRGTGKLGGMPLTFDWLKSFDDKAAVASEVKAQLPLSGPMLVQFGMPADLAPTGEMFADVAYTAAPDNTARLVLKGDLKALGFEVPMASFKKATGTDGSLDLDLALKAGQPARISDIKLKTGNTALSGNADFTGGKLSKAAFGQVVLGDTDVAVTVQPVKAGYDVKVTGRQADLSQLFQGDGKPGSDADAAKKVDPLTVSLNVGRIITGKDKALDKARIRMVRNEWQRIDDLELDGVAGGGALSVRYISDKGGHALNVQAANAGAALSVLGLTDGVRGGRLSVAGTMTSNSGPRDLAGTAVMADFTLVDAPVLARLLNAMSLSGIIELMNGKGIGFKRARTDFVWYDRGQPAEQKNVRLIKLKNGETSGASLGLTFEGNIDDWNKAYDLNGTIIPVSDLNKMISGIPIVGDILTAGGEGVFAATYTIKGPKSAPTVTVNPLAALAPGVLRKLFFEN